MTQGSPTFRGQRRPQTLIAKGLPYYSHGRITFARSGISPNFILTAATFSPALRLFGFAKGDDMGPAGRTGVFATEADTNLQTKSQTIDGELVRIMGVSMQITGQSDAALAVALLRDLSVKISLNGGDRAQLLGNGEMIPGQNGFFGGAGPAASTAAAPASMSNGWPSINNFWPVLGDILWQPAGATDSSLVVLVNLERNVVVNVVNAAAPASPFVDFRIQLIGKQEAPRSPNL